MAYVPGEYEPEVYPQGSMHHLRRGVVKQYKMPESCFALEYARGWIPPMLFFGFADGLSSTLDVQTLWKTTRITGREMISNLLKGKLCAVSRERRVRKDGDGDGRLSRELFRCPCRSRVSGCGLPRASRRLKDFG